MKFILTTGPMIINRPLDGFNRIQAKFGKEYSYRYGVWGYSSYAHFYMVFPNGKKADIGTFSVNEDGNGKILDDLDIEGRTLNVRKKLAELGENYKENSVR